MNAYELAELMLDVTDCETSEYYQAGMMLKQQADRIAELEKQTKPLSDEEIEKTFNNTFKVRDFDGEFLRFARAIEERHGIK